MPVCESLIGSREFPFLTPQNHEVTSEATEDYNCIAWAAGDDKRWWWPDRYHQAYWPSDVPRVATINSFVLAYQKLGYSMPSNAALEAGIDKIALFVDEQDKPTHAAKQLPDGLWSSKLGKSVDIKHAITSLDGPFYGKVFLYMRRGPSASISKPSTLTRAEIEHLDRYYREGGLRAMASPHVHYDDPACPHPGCGRRMEWIDFKLELHGDPEGVYKPLVRAWWDGTGFVGHCPACGGWVRFATLGMSACDDETASRLPKLPDNWSEVAQFA